MTPAQLGFRMPGEWEPHEATWIAWPHNRDDWPGKFAPVPWVYAEIVRHLSRVETVFIVVASAKMERRVADLLDRAGVNLRRSTVLPGAGRTGSGCAIQARLSWSETRRRRMFQRKAPRPLRPG